MTMKEFALTAMWLMLAVIFMLITVSVIASVIQSIIRKNKEPELTEEQVLELMELIDKNNKKDKNAR